MNLFVYGMEFQPIEVPHCISAIIEGLSKLNHGIYSKVQKHKFQIDGDWTIKSCDHFDNIDVILISTIPPHCPSDTLPQDISHLRKSAPNAILVMVDESDGLRTPGFSKGGQACDLVLKCHYNRKMKYPKNFVPWQFGISQRMIDAIQPIPVSERTASASVNFRVHHQLREYMNNRVLPIFEKYASLDTTVDNQDTSTFSENDKFLHQQARGRHNPFYYQRIPHNLFAIAYGGVFCLPFGNHNKYIAKIVRMLNNALPLFKFDRVRQWDSWRLWESMLAGCCTLHVDLEKYGCYMPVMPINYKDYIGVDPDNLDIFSTWLDKTMQDWKNGDYTQLQAMSDSARNFVLDNYHPTVVAQRFLDTLSQRFGQ